ncbi:DNA translocase FtsK [Alteromonas sp. C1M14]|uniref:DNA translocase FtsK n=1 Tax=Alteromonas sp. C1M14 TaxID=2841567 RepID=UPI001C0996A8|nr:DNA translocase FtsK [Alteromonas sp. C1M14]MBU2976820.1 DNA translocase FtsK 4TM domain-containing protein [Alteromonas sp. C1M14]
MARLTGLQRLLEAGMMVACVFAFFILLALASFHPGDPGWSQAGLQLEIHNWVGASGAWIADLLLFTFGWLAYLLPFCFAFLGWFLFQHVKELDEFDYLTIGLRIIGALLIALGITGIASINFNDLYNFSAGGFVGDVISSALIPYFNKAGTILLLLCFFCTGFTLLTGISWLDIIDKIGGATLWFGRKTLALPQQLMGLEMPKLALPARGKEAGEGTEQSLDITSLRAEPLASEPQSAVATQEPVQTAAERSEPSFGIPEEVFNTEDEPPFIVDDEKITLNPTAQPIEEEKKSSGFSLSHLKEKLTPQKKETANDAVDDAPTGPTAQKPVTKPQSSAKPTTLAEAVAAKEAEKAELATLGPMPSFDLLERPDRKENPITQEEMDMVSRLVETKLADFNIEANVVGVYPGPVITRFELDLAPGVKVSKITSLSKDLARAMSAISVRVVEVIPGKSVIGLELPNKKREMVRLSEVISSDAFNNNKSALTMVLGADISGKPVIVDLAKMPHLLVAGTTGSGKSVGVNVMILSLLYKSTPDDVRMIMIDPKMLELSVYEGIPHLLAEVVTDMKEAANALRWCVGEMERRYKLMSALGVRNLKGYNAKVLQAKADGEPIKDPLWRTEDSMEEEAPDLDKLPAIVVVVDEFADMMMIVGKKVEELIARIAQKARAAGIHLVLATQRPSVDVITGLIKANIPTRIAFQVSSKIDSRTILDQQGAEALLGMGDMLYLPPGSPVPTRVHGAFVDDHEVHAVVSDWKKRGKPDYIDEILNGEASAEVLLPGEQAENGDQEYDAFFDEAVAFVTETRRASVSSVQRKFRIGYNRAARLVEQMEANGVVSSPGHNGNREVLAPPAPKE